MKIKQLWLLPAQLSLHAPVSCGSFHRLILANDNKNTHTTTVNYKLFENIDDHVDKLVRIENVFILIHRRPILGFGSRLENRVCVVYQT